MRDQFLDTEQEDLTIKPVNLLDNYMKDLEKEVKEDETTKRVVFLTATSSYIYEPLNLFLKGPSSIGKTYVVMKTVNYFPKDRLMLLGGLSPTALVHDYGTLKDKDGEPFTMYDAPSKEAMKNDYKNEEDGRVDHRALNLAYAQARIEWENKLKDSYHEVKLGGKILVFLESPHEDTFMRLRPVLSHDAPEIEYKFTGEKLRAMTVKLVGWPATIFCTTETKYLEELATRSLTHTPDMNIEKYQKAVELIGHKAAHPLYYELEKAKKSVLHEFFSKTLPEHGLDVEPPRVVIPYHGVLSKIIKATQPRDMRDWQKMRSLIESSAMLHILHRPVMMMSIYPQVIANFVDLSNAASIFSRVEESTRSGLSGHIVSIFYDTIVRRWNKGGFPMKVQDLVGDYNAMGHGTISRKTFYKYLNALEDRAWVSTGTDPNDRRKKTVSVTKGTSENSLLSSLRQFQAVFTPQSLKQWVSEEIDLFTLVAPSTMKATVSLAHNSFVPMDQRRVLHDPSTSDYLMWTPEQEALFNEVLGAAFFEGLDLTLLERGVRKTAIINEAAPAPISQKVLDDGELMASLRLALEVLKDSVKQNGMNPVDRLDYIDTLIEVLGWTPGECKKIMGILTKEGMMYATPEGLMPVGGIF